MVPRHSTVISVLSMLCLSLLELLAAFILLKSTAAINGCPSTDSVVTGAAGIRYRICPETDLEGWSISVTPYVASVEACARLCDRSLDCFKAVYDTQGKSCHFKATTTLNWVPNPRFQVIQAEQINIARCPYEETSQISNGVSNKLKVGADFVADTFTTENLQDLPRHRPSWTHCRSNKGTRIPRSLCKTMLN